MASLGNRPPGPVAGLCICSSSFVFIFYLLDHFSTKIIDYKFCYQKELYLILGLYCLTNAWEQSGESIKRLSFTSLCGFLDNSEFPKA